VVAHGGLPHMKARKRRAVQLAPRLSLSVQMISSATIPAEWAVTGDNSVLASNRETGGYLCYGDFTTGMSKPQRVNRFLTGAVLMNDRNCFGRVLVLRRSDLFRLHSIERQETTARNALEHRACGWATAVPQSY